MTRRAPLPALIFALCAAAQSGNEHGVSAGPAQIAYLVKPIEVSVPPGVASRGGAPLNEDTGVLMAIEKDARANSGGAPVMLVLTTKDAVTGKETRRESVLAPLTRVPRLAFETWSEHLPGNYQESVLTGFSGFEWENNRTVIQRYVRDNFRHVEVRYSLTVETLPNSYRLGFRTSDSPAPANTDLKAISPAQFPVPQIVQDGDTLALELYADAGTGQKLVDYIHVLNQTPLRLRKEPARDSYSDDAEFAISQPQLKANGLAIQPGPAPETPHGQRLSVYIPGHGSFVLSLKPHPGFELAGEVSGAALTFSSAGNLFRIDCAERIASAGSAAYNVYVLRDPAAAAPQDSARFFITVGK